MQAKTGGKARECANATQRQSRNCELTPPPTELRARRSQKHAKSQKQLREKTAVVSRSFINAITIESRISAGPRTVHGAAFAHRTAMASAPERGAPSSLRARNHARLDG
eukprot:1230844-Prymnesium_polylepis.1